MRARAREFIEEMIRGELDTALARPRYGRSQMARSGERADVAGHRHGSRTRSLTGTFGPVEIAVPRARLNTSEGKRILRSETVWAMASRIGESCPFAPRQEVNCCVIWPVRELDLRGKHDQFFFQTLRPSLIDQRVIGDIICIRLSKHDLQLLDELCQKWGVSRSKAFRSMLYATLADFGEVSFDYNQLKSTAVCTENAIRVDSVIELPIVNDDGRAVILLACAVDLAVQVEEPT